MKRKLLVSLFGISLIFVMGFVGNSTGVDYAMNKAEFVSAVDGENP